MISFGGDDLWRRIGEAAQGDGVCIAEDIGFEVLDALGLDTPFRIYADGPDALEGVELDRFPGGEIVVKAVCPALVHKTEAGAVLRLPKDKAGIEKAMRAMGERVGRALGEGAGKIRYALHECVSVAEAPGNTFLMGLRNTPDFGPVLVLGMGGIYSEFWAEHLRQEQGLSFFSVPFEGGAIERAGLELNAAVKLGTAGFRGRAPVLSIDGLMDALQRFSKLGEAMPEWFSECEINPLVVSGGRIRPLDVRMVKGNPGYRRPVQKDISFLKHLLLPKSIAIAGVSERMNPGHIILKQLLDDGFDPEKIFVIKPGIDTLEGVKAVPAPLALPECADVLVAGISAANTKALLQSCIAHEKARCVVLISGGLEEKEGGRVIADELVLMLEQARAQGKDAPVVLGGNCLGFRSLPARCDAIFIPRYKLPSVQVSSETLSSMALVSQSGAFAIARLSKMPYLAPRYLITLGNQMDIGASDVLRALEQDSSIQTVGMYIEGFKEMDGTWLMETAGRMIGRGKSVILYRGGQNADGKQAALSHTARVAGDHRILVSRARGAGVLLCESIEDFEDLCSLFWCLERRDVQGRGLGVVTNAGFECVAAADAAGPGRLSAFAPVTHTKILQILAERHLDLIVDVHNPLDLTPMCDDAGYEACVRAVLEDSSVHSAIVGCVPLSPAICTLAQGAGHAEDMRGDSSVVQRMKRIWHDTQKALAVVVDSGTLYDAMAGELMAAGMPVFRHMDRAARILGRYVDERLRIQAIHQGKE